MARYLISARLLFLFIMVCECNCSESDFHENNVVADWNLMKADFYSTNFLNQSSARIWTIPRDVFKRSQGELYLAGRHPEALKKSNQGIILIKHDTKWMLICANRWSSHDADVACRQLGFPFGALHVITDYYNGAMKYIYADVNCVGNESELQNCKKTILRHHKCNNYRVAGVVCRAAQKKCRSKEFRCSHDECINAVFLCDGDKDCSNGEDENPIRCKEPFSIRLANGTTEASGRVEVKHHGVWGTVCDDNWDSKDAMVVCRMLGFSDDPNSVVAHHGAHFGRGSNVVWVDDLQCTGQEFSLEQCPKRPWGKSNCRHSEDAGVTCSTEAPIYGRNNIPSAKSSRTSCGRRSIEPIPKHQRMMGDRSRILGGTPSIPGSHPWQVGVRLRKENEVSHHCGAAILSEFYILSAAHCFNVFPSEAYIIRVGDYNNQVKDKEEQEFDVENIFVHDDFARDAYFNNDIALIRIKPKDGKGIKFGTYVQPICLPDLMVDFDPTGMHCVVSGWGSVGHQDESNTLQETEIPILQWSVCRNPSVYGPHRFTENMICAGFLAGHADACGGDSGGPLVCSNRNDRFFLFGIVSWGDGCGEENKPGVYVRVVTYIDWIKKHLAEDE